MTGLIILHFNIVSSLSIAGKGAGQLNKERVLQSVGLVVVLSLVPSSHATI